MCLRWLIFQILVTYIYIYTYIYYEPLISSSYRENRDITLWSRLNGGCAATEGLAVLIHFT